MHDVPSAARMSPEQRDIKPGTYWFRPLNHDRFFHYFGYVPTVEEEAAAARLVGLDGVVAAGAFRMQIMRDLLPSRVHNRFNTSGMQEILHRSQVWPMPVDLFEAVQRAGFDVRGLRYSDMREFSDLVQAFTDWQVASSARARRPLGDFLNEVDRIIDGLTSVRTRVGDRHLLVSTRTAHQQDQLVAVFEGHGFPVRRIGVQALSVKDRSEA